MNKLEVTKLVVATIVGSGTSKITSQIIANNTNPVTTFDKITNAAGSIVIGAMAAKQTKDYAGAEIDRYAALWNETKSKDTAPSE